MNTRYALLQVIWNDAGSPTVNVIAVEMGEEKRRELLAKMHRLNREVKDSDWIEYQLKVVGEPLRDAS